MISSTLITDIILATYCGLIFWQISVFAADRITMISTVC